MIGDTTIMTCFSFWSFAGMKDSSILTSQGSAAVMMLHCSCSGAIPNIRNIRNAHETMNTIAEPAKTSAPPLSTWQMPPEP